MRTKKFLPSIFADASSELPSWRGGVDAASADGVVDKQESDSSDQPPRLRKASGTPPIQEGSLTPAYAFTCQTLSNQYPPTLRH